MITYIFLISLSNAKHICSASYPNRKLKNDKFTNIFFGPKEAVNHTLQLRYFCLFSEKMNMCIGWVDVKKCSRIEIKKKVSLTLFLNPREHLLLLLWVYCTPHWIPGCIFHWIYPWSFSWSQCLGCSKSGLGKGFVSLLAFLCLLSQFSNSKTPYFFKMSYAVIFYVCMFDFRVVLSGWYHFSHRNIILI